MRFKNIKCPRCGCEEVQKRETVTYVTLGKKQQYYCKGCGHRFGEHQVKGVSK